MKSEFAIRERVLVPRIANTQGVVIGVRGDLDSIRLCVRFLDSNGDVLHGDYSQEELLVKNPPLEIIRQQQDFDLAQTRESLRRELEPHIRRELRNAARRKSPRKRR